MARLKLCAKMDEKADMLKGRFGGKILADMMQYKGHGFLNPWTVKVTGKHGELDFT